MEGSYTRHLSMKRSPSGICTPSGAYSGLTANWHDGTSMYCGWEEGSTKQNTGASSEFVWDSTSGTQLSRETSSPTPLFGNASLKWTGTVAGGTITEGVSELTEIAVRFRVKLTTNGLTTANDVIGVFYLRDSGDFENIASVGYRNVSGDLRFRFAYENSSDSETVLTGPDLTGIETDEFQVELRYNRATPFLGFKVWNAAGTSQIGSSSEVSNISTTNAIDQIIAGALGATLTASTTYLVDNVAVFADGDVYPGPEV